MFGKYFTFTEQCIKLSHKLIPTCNFIPFTLYAVFYKYSSNLFVVPVNGWSLRSANTMLLSNRAFLLLLTIWIYFYKTSVFVFFLFLKGGRKKNKTCTWNSSGFLRCQEFLVYNESPERDTTLYTKMAIIKRTNNNKSCRRCKQIEISYAADRNVKQCRHFGKQSGRSSNG